MDTRRGPRIQVDIKVVSGFDTSTKQSISLIEGNRLHTTAYDIALNGVGIYVTNFLPNGLILDLDIDGKSFGLAGPIKTKGEICHCNFIRRRRYKCGVKFSDISAGDREAIARFISSHTDDAT